MKRSANILLLLFVLCLLLPTGNAQAEIRKGAFTVSPMAGGISFDSDEIYDNTGIFGLGLGYNFTENWAGEMVFNYVDTEIKGLPGHVNAYIGQADLLYHFTPEKLATLYFAIGAGGIAYDYVGQLSPNDPEDEDFLLNYGLGLKVAFSEIAGLRLDVRHLYVIEDDDATSKEQNHLTYTGGLYFQFGG